MGRAPGVDEEPRKEVCCLKDTSCPDYIQPTYYEMIVREIARESDLSIDFVVGMLGFR